MEQENLILEAKPKSPLFVITPLSKYLALVLFILMPFIGGLIGYNHAPEKVVAVQRIIEVKKPPQLTEIKYIQIQEGLPAHGSYTYDLDKDKTDWVLYENKEYGFAFQHSPSLQVKQLTQDDFASRGWVDKTQDVAVFSLEEKWKPSIFVYTNTQKIKILELLQKLIYEYTSEIRTTEIDGRPAFWICSAEGERCSGYVVTENYIFRLDSITNITFDEKVVGASETNIVWPTKITVPTPSAVIEKTDDGWNTYTNTQYGFHVEYPPGVTNLGDYENGPNDTAIRFRPMDGKQYAPGSFVINALTEGTLNCSREIAGRSTPFTQILLNGISFTKYDATNNTTRFTNFCTINNGVMYLISIVPSKGVDVTEDAILNRVISSFRFI